MPKRKPPPWSSEEIAMLDDVYPREGINGAVDVLVDRSWHAIQVMAHKRGLKSPVTQAAPKAVLAGAKLEEAVRLREELGWSFARIGETLGVSEAGACNAVMIALCTRKGFTPAQRDEHGRMLPEGLERLRAMLRMGLKGIDIQLRLGLSAGRIAEERRRYSADLKARGKQPLPPPGGGERYSGVKLDRAAKLAVEQMLMEGYGAKKITERLGVSNTSIGRIRNRLIKRLKRKGETLTGCDAKGRRIAQKESARHVPPHAIAELRRLLREERLCIKRAALRAGMSPAVAFKQRQIYITELAAKGETLPASIRLGRGHAARVAAAADALYPTEHHAILAYRADAAAHGYPQAIEHLRAAQLQARREAAAAARRPLSFEEQLARVAAGARLVRNVPLRRPDPAMTLGGIASAAL